MIKRLFFLTVICSIFISDIYASHDLIQVGKKVPDMTFKGKGKDYNLNSWPNKMVIIYYGDPNHRNMADKTLDAIIKAVKDGRLTLKIYEPVVIVNCNISWLPNFLIRKLAYNKAKNPVIKPLVLFDYDGILNKSWAEENPNNCCCFIVIGKKGVCRAIFRGKMSKEQNDEMLNIAIKAQNEPGINEPDKKKSDSFYKKWMKKIWPE
jgi:predicted transcriptional regulator